jgi:hypothetical protein
MLFAAEGAEVYEPEGCPLEVAGRTLTEAYLLSLVEERSNWMNQNQRRIHVGFRVLQNLYSRERERLGGYREKNTERKFIEPVLSKVLGFNMRWSDDRRNTTIAGASIQPDIVLFPSEGDYDEALRARKSDPEAYFKRALCLVESEPWSVPLFEREVESRGGRRRRTASGRSRRSPLKQITDYLRSAGVSWGILTNGSQWVLVPREQRERSPTYVAFNFEEMLEHPGDHECFKAFKLFVFLLEKDAFQGWQEGNSRLDQIRGANLQRQARVEAGLHARVYPALLALSQGLHDYLRSNGRPAAPEDGKKNYFSSLYLLYRLLFVYYAESRGLLRIGDERFSIMKIREDCREAPVEWTPRGNRIDVVFKAPSAPFERNTYSIYSSLSQLFEFIGQGNQNWGLPAYNGDLFKTRNWPQGPDDLRISDYHIGIALHLLGYRHEGRQLVTVDYQNLGVRQLGAMYEHLLVFFRA